MYGKCSVRFGAKSGFVGALLLINAGPAFAIPSPELIVGSFVSVSQLFAVVSAILGGGAAYATMRARRHGSRDRSRSLLFIALGLFGLLAVSAGANIYQYIDRQNEVRAQLEETILRPSRTSGGLPLDPEVKELSYAQQTRHPDAMTTAEADTLLQAAQRGERSDLLFLDVRERAEREMGTLKGVTFVRYPDMAKSGIDFTNKKVILFCHNGNRSHETCEALKKQGIDCKFIVGGVEKWVTEGRSIDGLETRSLDQLRAIPDYKNKNTLLTTEQVRDLVAKEGAIFVDARYPFEFKTHGALPNAINLTIRRIPTDELPKAFADLPKKPIILPCYDRRGCFFAEVLGLELTRAGHNVRGRYTQPWLYFVKTPRPPHVETWVAENTKNIWAKAADRLAGLMEKVSAWTGLLGAIALLALISRLLVLPFSLKAERDQIRARATAAELASIKERLKDDPVRKTRAIRKFYDTHGFTPGRNLLALLFLPVMAVALLAVQELSARTGEGMFWIQNLAQRDPYYMLPLIFGVLIALYADLVFVTKGSHRAAVWLGLFPLMYATGTLFGAGANFYLIISATLLLLQRLWVSGVFLGLLQQRTTLPAGVVPLDDVEGLKDHGNKAYRLAQLRAAGLPVPDGVLLTPLFLKAFSDGNPMSRASLLDSVWRHLGRVPLAVRSSANAEDGANHSFAGVFESVVNVGRNNFEAAIQEVLRSYTAARVGGYTNGSGEGSVFVQRMVDAEFAGVLFTRDPSVGGLAMIELVQGTAESLVSGHARPKTYRYGRISRSLQGKSLPPIELAQLLSIGAKAEALFGGPQDIEWTYRSGKFFIVQSRDITRPVAGDAIMAAAQNDYARLTGLARGADPDEIVFAKNELAEMLPRPTPLSLSLMESLWASGGSIDLAARQLGLTYKVEEGSHYLTTVLGRLYVDKREEKSRAIGIGFLATRRLCRNADTIERELRDTVLPLILKEARLASVADFDKLSNGELVAEVSRLHDSFVYDTHVDVDVVNIAARFYLDRARRALTEAGHEPSSVLGHIPTTYEGKAIAEIEAAPAKARRWLLVKHFGHRAAMDYELAEPRYAEDMNVLERMFEARQKAAHSPQADTPPLGKALDAIVDVARRFQTLKEDAKHCSLREMANLRRVVLSLGRRFGLEERVFYLRFDELLTLNEQNAAEWLKVAVQRKEQSSLIKKSAALPSAISARDIEIASAGTSVAEHAEPGTIRGTLVSGSQVVEGRARVVSEEIAELGAPVEDFRDGDILVAPMVSPNWLPYFARAGGLVSQVGGWLSHPAILAREYDVAMIVGTAGIANIEDGAWLRLHLDGRIEVMPSKPEMGRVAAA
jgi:rifampicin phosphotransferase